MNVLYFDCFSGISGDMTLGALLDLGINEQVFKNEIKKLNLDDFDIEINKVKRCGITGVDVIITDQDTNPEHRHSRNYADICKIIDESPLSARVKDMSKRIFLSIASAEAKVHGKDIKEVHFHEIGAIDSIVDIVGSAVCLEMLDVDCVYSSPLHDGTGSIKCAHGVLPVPVPAVLEMLADSGIPVITEDISTELVTPTGLGIIKNTAKSFGRMPVMFIKRTGYGMGKRDTGRLNALRVIMGQFLEEDSEYADNIEVIETNIDDMSPEILAYAMNRLFAGGALDVTYTPVYMKKNRPAYMLTVICKPEKHDTMADIIMKETTTLGIRWHKACRDIMKRRSLEIDTKHGRVSVKIAEYKDITKIYPEYESCMKIASEKNIPLQEIYQEAIISANRERKD